jgi:hypothetical protein
MTNIQLTLGIAILLGVASAPGVQHPHMPAGVSHEEHLRHLQKDEALAKRGNLAMGFDQDRTVHRFLLSAAGGAIVVIARDAGDVESISQVRTHLREIAAAFGRGAFDAPVATHAELPPGAATMAANARLIKYRYEERAAGGALTIETDDARTFAAIHDFLRYQIVEHKTGDPLTVTW